ncbi:tRNA (N6-threonylcarbamoyladenosine(37)-N6)-methyltransferase TrmO [bacterium]|nr:tRNA (N6-threonylcarbamoyladenosine(37)-N6)-methyltransferase TrmO [bacterium]
MSDVKEFHLRAIGTIHTPFEQQAGTPIQPFRGKGKDTRAIIEIMPEYREGLKDLDGFERIWLLFGFHKSSGYNLNVTPYLDTAERGLFATRAPRRPNPVGLSCTKLLSVDMDAGRLEVQGVDMLDGTPLFDIKPYIPRSDAFPDSRFGWLEIVDKTDEHADDRFSR